MDKGIEERKASIPFLFVIRERIKTLKTILGE